MYHRVCRVWSVGVHGQRNENATKEGYNMTQEEVHSMMMWQ